jgi:predicted DNA-binding transcriptional regulator YafY
MSRPTTRVLAVLELLQTYGRMSGAELARRLQVDRRTVRRYIAALEELGIPVTAELGSAGGYMLVAGFKLPPMMFTDDEALALAVGLLAARGLGLAEAGPAAASARAKLERVMPANLKRRVRAVGETVTLDLSRPAAPGDHFANAAHPANPAHPANSANAENAANAANPANAANIALVALSTAAEARQRVSLRYRTARHEETERGFDPYGLAYSHGAWYAVGMCHLRGGLRSFRLDRVRSVLPLAATFVRPPGFDALAHVRQAVATIPRAWSAEVLLAADLETARREVFPSAGLLEGTADGVLLRSEVDDLDWFARELARLPFALAVRRPRELRDALAAHARRLLAQAGLSRPAEEPAAEAASPDPLDALAAQVPSGGASTATCGDGRGSPPR